MKIIFTLVIPIVLLVMGVQYMRDYLFGADKVERKKLESLVSSGQETIAVLDPEYKATTIKIRGAHVTTYEVGYKFRVNDQTFSGTKMMETPPTEPVVTIKYLPENPSVNSIAPDTQLNTLNEHEHSIWTFFKGLGIFFAGLLWGFITLVPRAKPTTA